MDEKLDIAQVIRVGRARLGIRQNELAKLVGTSNTSISEWEKGERMPAGDALVKIANILDVVADLFPNYDVKKKKEAVKESKVDKLEKKIDKLEELLIEYVSRDFKSKDPVVSIFAKADQEFVEESRRKPTNPREATTGKIVKNIEVDSVEEETGTKKQ